MKLRLALTIELVRGRQREAADEPPHVDEKSSSLVEVAERSPIGFRVDPTHPSDPFETDDRRVR